MTKSSGLASFLERNYNFGVSNKLIFLTFAVSLSACASISLSGCASGDGEYRRSTEADNSGSTAPGWAYAAEGFTVNKNQRVRSQNAYEFYYKRCELGGERAYYSKTSYECSEAPR
jgi:hypothetical protein